MLDLSKNHFELFGLAVSFDLDLEDLAKRYRDLQRVVHPDRFVNATDRERRLSMQGATRINEAYATLRDPLARGRYLLGLRGVDMSTDQGTTRDAGFLMRQMELREELAEAKHRSDPFAALDALTARIDRQIQQFTQEMAGQVAGVTPRELDEARESVFKLQFLHKLRTQAEAVEAELDELL